MEIKEFFGASVEEALEKARRAGFVVERDDQYRVVDNLAARPLKSEQVAVLLETTQPIDNTKEYSNREGVARGRLSDTEKQAREKGERDWAMAYCQGILERMGLSTRMHDSDLDEQVLLHVDCEEGEMDLKRGIWREFRGALQHLVNRSASRGRENEQRYILDLCGTLSRRMRKMEQLAEYLGKKVPELGKSLNILLMDSQDRRLLHVKLADNEGVKTTAAGSKRYRILTTSPSRKE
ncbi:MAG: hypothetical protein DRI34_00790 [Deltaproteobacteria bacterium]|nr:MAG: hypothetical protein DRI34_00790 [Deltaproteobacteria bacterium]